MAFSVAPDGSVADVAVLRHSATFDRAWIEPVQQAIAGRRYAPLDVNKLPAGLQRLERYTLTADAMTVTGSRIAGQASAPRVEMMDLSEDGQGTRPAR